MYGRVVCRGNYLATTQANLSRTHKPRRLTMTDNTKDIILKLQAAKRKEGGK